MRLLILLTILWIATLNKRSHINSNNPFYKKRYIISQTTKNCEKRLVGKTTAKQYEWATPMDLSTLLCYNRNYSKGYIFHIHESSNSIFNNKWVHIYPLWRRGRYVLLFLSGEVSVCSVNLSSLFLYSSFRCKALSQTAPFYILKKWGVIWKF